MTEQTLKKAKKFLQVLDIADSVIRESNVKPEKEMKDSLSFNEEIRSMGNGVDGESKLTSYRLKYPIHSLTKGCILC